MPPSPPCSGPSCLRRTNLKRPFAFSNHSNQSGPSTNPAVHHGRRRGTPGPVGQRVQVGDPPRSRPTGRASRRVRRLGGEHPIGNRSGAARLAGRRAEHDLARAQLATTCAARETGSPGAPAGDTSIDIEAAALSRWATSTTRAVRVGACGALVTLTGMIGSGNTHASSPEFMIAASGWVFESTMTPSAVVSVARTR
jgi:hypothetical protein